MESSNTVIVSVMVEEKGKQAEERQDKPRLWRPWRPPRKRRGWRVLWAVGMVVAVLTTVLTTALLIVVLRPEIWKDLLEGRVLTLVALGFSVTAIIVLLAIASARRSWTGFQGKTVWDFLQLLIVPLMLVALGFWVTTRQEVHQQQIEGRRTDQAQHLENQRSQDTALQAYFDGMTNLLIDEQGNQLHKLDPDTEVQDLIQARTETLFAIIDKDREVSVVLFLARSDVIPKGDPLVSLAGIDLSFIDLRGIDLSETSLAASNLAHAILTNVNLSRSDLGHADLSEANLSGANLRDAFLFDANLSGADLRGANLSHADLRGANLYQADLRGADLRGADLRGAYKVTGVGPKQPITNEELVQQTKFLEGATMPNGQKYEDWLKDKESGKQNE